MTGKDRTEKVEEFVKQSREADDLASTGKKEQTLQILRDSLAKATGG